MKIFWLVLVAIFFSLSAAAAAAGARQPGHAAKSEIPLHSGWMFREAGGTEWRPATVPGCVHTDLLAAKSIEDPFYRDNEKHLQWIGKTDWEYQTTFSLPPGLLRRRNIDLVFEGLDTYADVFLNGAPVLKADNMFRRWRVSAKANLKAGENVLRIRFRSPINEILPLMKKLDYELPAVNDQGEKTSPYTRKAPYQYGWDWGPRFVTSGVWKPVYLEVWDEARIDDLNIRQKNLTAEKAAAAAEVEVVASSAAEVTIALENVTDRRRLATKRVRLAPGANRVVLDFAVENPKIWFPAGYGGQPLYKFEATLSAGGGGARTLDRAARRTGFRTLELRQKTDQWGKSFEFVVNGIPVFAKGGNWIPADSFPSRVTREKYRRLLESVRDANMNMVRVWGGGIYEDDYYYDLADELGLLVWQDFMFACSMYPGDKAFLENVRREAIDNVKRLRNHPSIVLWCGNNEIETAWQHWGWKERLPDHVWDDYKKIFARLLPDVVEEYHPEVPYWSSSPSSDFEDDADSPKSGDVHYWAVWHASMPFEEYKKQFPRFMSEYGFQSFPELETVKTYTTAADRASVETPVMLAHQRHPRGNQLIREYMLREYEAPKDFESFLYVSQVLQADGIKLGTEHFRRSRPRNMGALYWQINDVWTVASWSGMDYFGRWKAMQYAARRFFNDLLVSPNVEDGKMNFYVVSDRPTPARAQLNVRLMDFAGKILDARQSEINVEPLRSKSYLSIPADELTRGRQMKNLVLVAELKVGGRTVSRNEHFFRPFKELSIPRPTIDWQVATTANGFKLTLSSDKFARAVYLNAADLEGFFSDNYFNLVPGEPAEIEFRTGGKTTPEAFRQKLKIKSLVDAF